MFDDLDWSVIFLEPGRGMLLSGLSVTLQLTVLGIVFSTIVGLLVAMGTISTSRPLAPLRWVLTAYVQFFRNVPLLVQLVFWAFALFSLDIVRALASPLNVLFTNQFIAGLCGLIVYTSAYIAEVLRSGFQSVPRGQMEAAQSSGLGYVGAMRYVIIPQVFRIVLPALGTQYIGLTKNTSVVMFIGAADLLFQAQQIESSSFRAFEAFTTVMVIYVGLCLMEGALLHVLAKRMSCEKAAPTVAHHQAVVLESAS